MTFPIITCLYPLPNLFLIFYVFRVTMTTLRQFTCDDLFRFNGINLDPLTEMYGLSFYLQYLARWPEYFLVAESPSGTLMGYIMGKSEVKSVILCLMLISKKMLLNFDVL